MPVVTWALFTAAVLAAPIGAAAADSQGKYRDLLKSQGASGVVKPILAAFGDRTAADAIEQLAKTLVASSQNAVAVLDALAADESVEAASVRAELLYAITARIGGSPLMDDPGWKQFVEKGVALLDHDDPFVRGIAAWALTAVRDANPSIQPQPDMPEGKAKRLAWRPETSVESDFVLQAFSLGVHRTTRDLAKSAHEILKRAEKVASYAQSCGSDDRRQRVVAALATLEKVHARSKGERSPTDLTGQRKW